MDSGTWSIVALVFVGGLMVGTSLGVAAMALIVASGRADDGTEDAEWENL